MSVYGYDENQNGQLVKQVNHVGFTGVATDKVGPGDYEVENAHRLVGKKSTGAIAWKPPKTAATDKTRDTKKPQLPGPGEYDVTSRKTGDFRQPSSMFQSKVPRT